MCACSCGIPGMESVCIEHLGEQQLLEVRSCYAAGRNAGNNCCENISSGGMNIAGFGRKTTVCFCDFMFNNHKDKKCTKRKVKKSLVTEVRFQILQNWLV